MFMEYVVGGELFTHLRDAGRFNDTAARFYAAEVLLAIDYLHARNVVYRDLKVPLTPPRPTPPTCFSSQTSSPASNAWLLLARGVPGPAGVSTRPAGTPFRCASRCPSRSTPYFRYVAHFPETFFPLPLCLLVHFHCVSFSTSVADFRRRLPSSTSVVDFPRRPPSSCDLDEVPTTSSQHDTIGHQPPGPHHPYPAEDRSSVR
jgi:hypothetical protein